MLVQFNSGRRLEIPGHHTVFMPVGEAYAEGDRVDPASVRFLAERADACLRDGVLVIVDNVVEVVRLVLPSAVEVPNTYLGSDARSLAGVVRASYRLEFCNLERTRFRVGG